MLQESERKFLNLGIIHDKRMQNGQHDKVACAREFRDIHRNCAVVIAGKQGIITFAVVFSAGDNGELKIGRGQFAFQFFPLPAQLLSGLAGYGFEK